MSGLLLMALLSAHHADSARAWIRASIDALGGETALRGLQALHMVGVHQTAGLAFSPHQSEPRIAHEIIDDWRDVEHRRSSTRVISFAPSFRDGLSYRVVVDADQRVGVQETDRFGTFPIDSAGVATYAHQFALSPERLLLTALAASDLTVGGDTTIGAMRYHTVIFDRGTTRVTVNAISHLPLAVETTRATTDPDWTVWGDIVDRTTFSSWSLDRGVHLPRTRTTTRNGMPFELVSLRILDVVDPIAPDSFAIPDSSRRGAPPLALGPAHEITDGIAFIPAIWNVMLVRQPDGVVVIEAPHSPAYSRLVIAEAARRFPGAPIKAVVTTDFMWSHHAGVREYVARGVQVFAPASNVEMLRRIMASPHRIAPDSLARAPRPAKITGISSRVSIGTGPNRIELISALAPGTDYGERMIVAYLPERRLLYASDLLATPAFEPNFVSQATADVRALVAREQLSVDSVAAIHIPPRAWARDTVDANVGRR